MKNKNILISIDPGKKNFAYSVMTKKGKVIEYGMFKEMAETANEGKQFVKELKYFKNEIYLLLEKYKNCKCILVYERFMPRGMHRANLAEIVNFLICTFIMCTIDYSFVGYKPVTASAWKKFNKNREMIVENKSIPVHVCDTFGMSLYFLVKNKYMTEGRARKIAKKLSN